MVWCGPQVRGKLTCLLINDLDAGVGRFGNTQVWRLARRRGVGAACFLSRTRCICVCVYVCVCVSTGPVVRLCAPNAVTCLIG